MALTVMGGGREGGGGKGGEGRGTRRKSILLNILLKKVVRCHGISTGKTNWPTEQQTGRTERCKISILCFFFPRLDF